MDSCCATLQGNAHPVKFGRGGVRNMGAGIWGESMRGCLKSRDLRTQFLKNSKSESSRVTKFKPGVAYSVLTDINQEALVSESHIILPKSDFEQWDLVVDSLTVVFKIWL